MAISGTTNHVSYHFWFCKVIFKSHLTDVTTARLHRHLSNMKVHSSAVITRFNIVRYCINYYRNWGRISIRCWIKQDTPYLTQTVKIWGVICEKTDRIIMALHCSTGHINWFDNFVKQRKLMEPICLATPPLTFQVSWGELTDRVPV